MCLEHIRKLDILEINNQYWILASSMQSSEGRLLVCYRTKESSITYDELSTLVNSRYQSLEDGGVKDIQTKLKQEFNLSTSVLWELLGLKDLIEFQEPK